MLVAAALLLGASIAVAVKVWQEIDGAAISDNGMLALVAGSVATLLLTVVLVGLVFLSSRRGFDDEAGHD